MSNIIDISSKITPKAKASSTDEKKVTKLPLTEKQTQQKSKEIKALQKIKSEITPAQLEQDLTTSSLSSTLTSSSNLDGSDVLENEVAKNEIVKDVLESEAVKCEMIKRETFKEEINQQAAQDLKSRMEDLVREKQAMRQQATGNVKSRGTKLPSPRSSQRAINQRMSQLFKSISEHLRQPASLHPSELLLLIEQVNSLELMLVSRVFSLQEQLHTLLHRKLMAPPQSIQGDRSKNQDVNFTLLDNEKKSAQARKLNKSASKQVKVIRSGKDELSFPSDKTNSTNPGLSASSATLDSSLSSKLLGRVDESFQEVNLKVLEKKRKSLEKKLTDCFFRKSLLQDARKEINYLFELTMCRKVCLCH